MSGNSFEDRSLEKGRQIFHGASRQKKGFLSIGLDEHLMEWAIKNEALKDDIGMETGCRMFYAEKAGSDFLRGFYD